MIAPAYRYRAEARRIVDGDTFTAAVDLGFRVRVEHELRLLDAWAPERDQLGGLEARDALAGLLYSSSGAGFLPVPLVVETHKTRAGADVLSFTRYVADVWLPDGRNVSEALVALGHATATRGG